MSDISLPAALPERDASSRLDADVTDPKLSTTCPLLAPQLVPAQSKHQVSKIGRLDGTARSQQRIDDMMYHLTAPEARSVHRVPMGSTMVC